MGEVRDWNGNFLEIHNTMTMKEFIDTYRTTSQDDPNLAPCRESFLDLTTLFAPLRLMINNFLGFEDSTNPDGIRFTFYPICEYLYLNYGNVELRPEYACYIPNEGEYYTPDFGDDKFRPWYNPHLFFSAIASILSSKKYKYTTLINSMQLDYNPIWNVDSHETSTESRGARVENNQHGAKTTTFNNAARSNSYTHGKEKETETMPTETVNASMGAVKETTGIEGGNKVETTTHFNSQMNDTNDWYNHDRDETVTQPYIEYKNTPSRTDITTRTITGNHITENDSYTDNESLGAHNDSENVGAHTDVLSKEAYKDEIEITRQGNIGTKTTQSMIQEEREVANFDLASIICKDIVKKICIAVYY